MDWSYFLSTFYFLPIYPPLFLHVYIDFNTASQHKCYLSRCCFQCYQELTGCTCHFQFGTNLVMVPAWEPCSTMAGSGEREGLGFRGDIEPQHVLLAFNTYITKLSLLQLCLLASILLDEETLEAKSPLCFWQGGTARVVAGQFFCPPKCPSSISTAPDGVLPLEMRGEFHFHDLLNPWAPCQGCALECVHLLRIHCSCVSQQKFSLSLWETCTLFPTYLFFKENPMIFSFLN